MQNATKLEIQLSVKITKSENPYEFRNQKTVYSADKQIKAHQDLRSAN